MLKGTLSRVAFVAAGSVVAVSAFAVGPASPDLTALTPDFTTVTTAMLAIAGVVAGVIVTWKGVKWGYKVLSAG